MGNTCSKLPWRSWTARNAVNDSAIAAVYVNENQSTTATMPIQGTAKRKSDTALKQ